MKFINYDKSNYQFRETIENVLNTKNLEKIHLEENYELFVKGTDQSTKFHKLYYGNLDKFLPVFFFKGL